MENYVNYHKHTHYSNIITPDSAVTPFDYAKRVVELGQTVLSGLEHGYQGNYIETYELAKENGLKFLFGTEAYIVKDRTIVVDDKKDATNSHIVLLAKNELGRKGINRILSQASIDGFYYKPRIDLELLFTLDKNSVWVTSACIAGLWKYDDYERIFLDIYSHFGNNFFLEVQNHDIKRQAELNKRIINLSNRYGINIIAGMDSHYIYSQQAQERDDFLASRNIEYEDEVGWNMDFPSYEEAFIRFQKQGALTDAQIKEALDNTMVFEQVEEYQSRIFNKDIKLPTLYPEKQQEEKNQIFIDLVNEKWQIEKENVLRTKWNKYEKEIKTEVDTVIETGMADYFLLDYEIIKKGIADGGHITLTSRGSAPSYYISKLLGFTTIDRISAEVKLFPERFITKERILEAGTLPDIDFNLGNPEIFAQAQKDILGNDNSYPMIAYGTARPKASWKIYARAKGIDFDMANDISKDIDRYEMALKHAETEEEREEIDVLDYINPKFIELYKESQIYKGIISDAKIAPCGYLIYDEPISEEIGLIKLKENICTVMDGSWAEKYSFLKNDLLKVSVVELIYRIYKRIGIKPHSLPELIKLCDGNNKVWEVYKNGWTMGINQLEQDATRGRVAKYAPKNISELSAFIAAIRPGFKSYYSRFESREPFEYGIKTLDELIQTEQFPYSYMLYQENAMQVLAYSGIRIAETYEIIKNIAKKRAEKVYKYKDRFIDGMKNRLMKKESLDEIASAKVAQNTWQVIEDSAHYSFNSSHAYSVAGDSLYGAYLKSHYPLEFYETLLTICEEDGDKDRLAKAKEEAKHAYKISFPPYRFGQDNRNIVLDKDNWAITSSLKSIKSFGKKVGEDMYDLSQLKFDSFFDLLIYAENNGILYSHFEKLIYIQYFDNFGGNKKLYKFYKEFTEGKNRYSSKHTDKTKGKRIVALKEYWDSLQDENFDLSVQLSLESDILGNIQAQYDIPKDYLYVMAVDLQYAPRATVYCLANGKINSIKIRKKVFDENVFYGGEVIKLNLSKRSDGRLLYFIKEPRRKYVGDGKYEDDLEDFDWWAYKYDIIPPDNFNDIVKGTKKK